MKPHFTGSSAELKTRLKFEGDSEWSIHVLILKLNTHMMAHIRNNKAQTCCLKTEFLYSTCKLYISCSRCQGMLEEAFLRTCLTQPK